MTEKVLNELDEAKATGEDSVAADATTPAGGNPKKRLADAGGAPEAGDDIEKNVKTPQGTNDAGLKEAVDGLFEGSELSEDFKVKTVAIFEAALHEKTESIRAELQEKFEVELNEQVVAATSELVEKVDAYLDYVAEKWLADNEVAVEAGIKVQMAESLMTGLKSLFTEHNIDVSDETVNNVTALELQISEMNNKYNEAVSDIIAIKEAKEALEREIAFKTISEGLADTQVERLRTLSEGVHFDTVTDYTTKLSVIKESFFNENVKVNENDVADLLEEETNTDKVNVSTEVDLYVKHIDRMFS